MEFLELYRILCKHVHQGPQQYCQIVPLPIQKRVQNYIKKVLWLEKIDL